MCVCVRCACTCGQNYTQKLCELVLLKKVSNAQVAVLNFKGNVTTVDATYTQYGPGEIEEVRTVRRPQGPVGGHAACDTCEQQFFDGDTRALGLCS